MTDIKTISECIVLDAALADHEASIALKIAENLYNNVTCRSHDVPAWLLAGKVKAEATVLAFATAEELYAALEELKRERAERYEP